ncbi:MAG: Cys-tRNA(Pro) deacylase [Lachnospiraceae bacterium]|nr:Cys-tRNA(Pro) deacylase [Lachnospiraceae bacterium]
MAKEKDTKTNAMRILDRNNVVYKVNTYESDEFVDGKTIADKLGQDYASSFKTLVTKGRSGDFYVFVIPIAEELNLKKAAKSVKEKSVEMVHVKDINSITGYIRGGCSPLGMKKQYDTVVHNSAKEFDEIIISGGRIGSQIIINPDELIRVIGGKYDDIVI